VTAAKKAVLVIYKRSRLQEAGRGRARARMEQLIAARDPTVQNVLAAHRDHQQAIRRTRNALQKLGVRALFRYRFSKVDASDFDLVVTLGGDGTLLWASHLVASDTPMVAVNSSPRASVGYFCAGTLENLEETLERALGGRLPVTRLTRMRVELDDETISTRVLNDILFCHKSPAVTCRYLIEHRGEVEDHRSSGIWAGPAAGSTAAQRSAGGRVLPITSKKLQYVVREPYQDVGRPPRLVCGLVAPGERLVLRSKMRDGRIFVDGAHHVHAVDVGSVVRLSRSSEPLLLLGLRRAVETSATEPRRFRATVR
jgi:NAD+ kinase